MEIDQVEKEQITKKAIEVTTHTMALNILLASFKLFAGIFANSQAMIADSIHSIADFATTLVVRMGIKYSSKQADDDHQYGHETMESIAVLIVAIVLGVTGILLGLNGITSIVTAQEFITPGLFALVAVIISIIVKEGMFRYVYSIGKKLGSEGLIADAWHNRSDALSSLGTLVGVLGAIMGFPILDSLAAVVICVFILKVALTTGKDAVNKLTDKTCDLETLNKIKEIITSHPEVRSILNLKTRVSANKIYVDIDIALNGDLTFALAHEIADILHDEIELQIPEVKHCMIHVEPEES